MRAVGFGVIKTWICMLYLVINRQLFYNLIQVHVKVHVQRENNNAGRIANSGVLNASAKTETSGRNVQRVTKEALS